MIVIFSCGFCQTIINTSAIMDQWVGVPIKGIVTQITCKIGQEIIKPVISFQAIKIDKTLFKKGVDQVFMYYVSKFFDTIIFYPCKTSPALNHYVSTIEPHFQNYI